MRSRVFGAIIFILLCENFLYGQILKDLEKAAINKAKGLNTKENRDKLVDVVMKDMERARAEFDSSDFDYAILLSDNSGLFDVKEKGEGSARLTPMVSLGSTYSKSRHLPTLTVHASTGNGEVLYASPEVQFRRKQVRDSKGCL